MLTGAALASLLFRFWDFLVTLNKGPWVPSVLGPADSVAGGACLGFGLHCEAHVEFPRTPWEKGMWLPSDHGTHRRALASGVRVQGFSPVDLTMWQHTQPPRVPESSCCCPQDSHSAHHSPAAGTLPHHCPKDSHLARHSPAPSPAACWGISLARCG